MYLLLAEPYTMFLKTRPIHSAWLCKPWKQRFGIAQSLVVGIESLGAETVEVSSMRTTAWILVSALLVLSGWVLVMVSRDGNGSAPGHVTTNQPAPSGRADFDRGTSVPAQQVADSHSRLLDIVADSQANNDHRSVGSSLPADGTTVATQEVSSVEHHVMSGNANAPNRAYEHGPHLDFRGKDLAGADFRGDDMTNADLRGANLTDADFSDANLSGANLEEAVSSRPTFTAPTCKTHRSSVLRSTALTWPAWTSHERTCGEHACRATDAGSGRTRGVPTSRELICAGLTSEEQSFTGLAWTVPTCGVPTWLLLTEHRGRCGVRCTTRTRGFRLRSVPRHRK